jgi:predicted transcriptional regulator
MNRSRSVRGGLESEIVRTLDGAAEPLTPRQVQTMLDRELAYTSVMTTLARLERKGVLERERRGRGFAYRLSGDDESAARAGESARRMRQALDSSPDRNVALLRFVGELRPEDEALLTELLKQSLAKGEGEDL